ncbi:hypothetical protein [Actinocorallia libanotica]|uniref:LVIVD repeat-containing protein n=1 Tax=Actinocorallia libanotica TaxID=46162 RepID=A0ABP4BS84_9ACTN
MNERDFPSEESTRAFGRAAGERRWVKALAGASAVGVAVSLALVGQAATAEAGGVSSVVPRAECGPGSSPETGLQGQVPLADRRNGRSKQGYSCNLELVSRFQGEGQGAVGARYGTCQYLGTTLLGALNSKKPGVQVVDMKNPKKPRLSTTLVSPATTAGTWETLKVHEGRGLLAAVSVGMLTGGFFVSVYDVKTDCARPRLLNGIKGTSLTMPGAIPGHEASWSPDGRTYWAAGNVGGTIAALDMTDPRKPKVVYNGVIGLTDHGIGIRPDGDRIYVSNGLTGGVTLFDSTEIQQRRSHPRLRRISEITWSDGLATQHAIPFTDRGRPYLMAVDELGSGGARIIDIADERKPRIIRKLKLEINRPEHLALREAELAKNGMFGYDSHYCTLDRGKDPEMMACGWFQSGIRVFDIRDLRKPREIAYYNPPAQAGMRDRLPQSAHAAFPVGAYLSDVLTESGPSAYTGKPDMTADWCSSPPFFDGNRLWVACSDNGALLLRLTNGAKRI